VPKGVAPSETVPEQRAEVQRALRRVAEVLADGLPIDADVLAGVARHLDEAHLEHDLLRAADLEVVQHLRTVLLRERDRARRRDAVVHGAGEDGAAVRRGDAGALAGQALLDVGGEPRRVVADLDLDHADERFRGIVDRDVGGAELLAEDVHGAVGERHHVGDLGVADDEVDEAERGLQRLRLALRDAHGADLVLADLDDAGLGRGRRERRRDEERRAGERRRDRERERQRPLMEAPPPRPRPESCRLALSCHGLPRPVFLCPTGNARGVNQG
jgi:hypothetical protein